MNKKILAIIAAAVLVAAISFFFLVSNKGNKPAVMNRSSSGSESNILNRAKNFEAKGDLVSAKAQYQQLVNDFTSSSEIMNWQKKIEEINIKLLFSPIATPGSILYEIKPGDTLTKISKEFKTTVELIKKSNGLRDDNITPGRKIKVWTTPFNILVDKSQNTLTLKTSEEIFKTYIVSTGKNNSTPVGNLKITNKLTNPTWFKAGAVVPANSPENILGTRWLGFDKPGYGIHGTTEPQSLGRQVTQGCVRMANPEVEELYIIVSVGTEVTIVD